MKKILLLITTTLFFAGCSNTWDGVKDDSSKIWNDTKEAVHEATE
ncbi:membrane lipoprotein lipid attachment site-containing protein [Vibrio hannami]|nr:membrane lipoprotein lipid attachment site-containing protein [Vibrio hannami]MDG3085498.1 membrane lipoprotein lipid attachment site-containing protein [Vibrio hannami]